MKSDKPLSHPIESLAGDMGTLYSQDGGYVWYVKYEAENESAVLAKSKVPLSIDQANALFERGKDIVLLETEKQGQILLDREEGKQ